MPLTVLTIDDSRAVRMLVSKNAREMGLEVVEAEDGKQGLARLADGKFDLIVLDITMPELDGPGMLTALRERGDRTPVLMLTSESKRSIVASLMKLGIEDYILKPFKGDELKRKMAKVLHMNVPVPVAIGDGDLTVRDGAPLAAAPAPAAVPTGAAGAAADILCVDDMENVHKRLRALIPEPLTLHGAANAQAALALCRERTFRVLLIDNDMPGVDSPSLMRQLRVLQPQAVCLTL